MQTPATSDTSFGEVYFNLVEAAIRNEEAIESAIRKMQATDEMLRERDQTLPAWVAGEVDNRLEKVVKHAAKQITAQVTSDLTAVNEAASRLRVQYENAAKFAPKSVVLTALACFFFGCIGMLIGVYLSARVFLPAPDVLQRERQAEQNVEKLAPRGGNSVLTMCKTAQGERQCVRTEERGQQIFTGAGGETYRIIYGY
jgi:hypothetical protein